MVVETKWSATSTQQSQSTMFSRTGQDQSFRD